MIKKTNLFLIAVFLSVFTGCGGGGGGSSSLSSDTTSTNIVKDTIGSVAFSTPSNFSSVLNTVYQPPSSLTTVSSFTARNRYLVGDSFAANSSTNFLSIGSTALSTDSTYGTVSGYAATASKLGSSATMQNYLASMVVAVPSADGNFRFDSHLNPNDAIDYVSGSLVLKFSNNFGLTSSVGNGFITFTYDAVTHLIQAKNRYIYSLSSSVSTNPPVTIWTGNDTLDSGFTAANYYLKLSNGSYTLVPSSVNATAFYLFNSPLDFSIPTDFNPAGKAYVTNSPAPFVKKVNGVSSIETSSSSSSIYTSLNSSYKQQVLYPGSNASTKIAADAMLASIVVTASSNNFNLRYDASLYTAYRDATLTYTLGSDSITDGVPGQHLVPFVYYTNEKDTNGVYHPMMVIVHYGNQASPNGLIDVNHPPGSGGAGGYAAQNVTRYSNIDYYVTAIPLKDYGTVTSVFSNTLSSSLLSDTGVTPSASNVTVYNYASTADNGLLMDGSVIFPIMNNTLIPSQTQAELSANGCHVGQGGGGPHCHADGYKSGSKSGIGIYGDTDYVGKTHPPLIGFGYDGIALYGQYRGSNDQSLLGYSTTLDQFGAHSHDGLGYHYHAHTLSWAASGSIPTFNLRVLLKGAWSGNINSIPYFYQHSTFSNNKYLGGN